MLPVIITILCLVLMSGYLLKKAISKDDWFSNSLANHKEDITDSNTFLKEYLHPSESKIGYYLVFDIETTGLPKKRNASIHDISNWPRIVSLGYLLYDFEGKVIERFSTLLKQYSPIPKDSIKIHGITNEECEKNGIVPSLAYKKFAKALENSKVTIAHNIDFDLPIIQAEFYRLGLSKPFNDHRNICTMKLGTDFCAIPSGYSDYKWPTLIELFTKCFTKNRKTEVTVSFKHHDVESDVLLTAACFFRMIELQVITKPTG